MLRSFGLVDFLARGNDDVDDTENAADFEKLETGRNRRYKELYLGRRK